MSGIEVDDLLVAQADDDAERPVGGAVLRADVEVHERGVVLGARQAPLLGLEAQLLLHLVGELVGQVEGAVLGAAGRVLLAQRVPVPPRRHEQAVEVGVAGDADAEHVPELALVPVGGGPHAGHRVHLRLVRRQRHLEAHVGVPAVGDEVVEDAEGGVGHALAVLPLALVDAAEVVEHRERLGGLACRGTAAPRRPGPPASTPWGCRPRSSGRRTARPGSARAAPRARPAAGLRLRRPSATGHWHGCGAPGSRSCGASSCCRSSSPGCTARPARAARRPSQLVRRPELVGRHDVVVAQVAHRDAPAA